MVRALPSAIPPKMYRHFALVTVALTTGIALFADGENREARARQVEAREEPEAPRQEIAVSVPRPAPPRRTKPPFHGFEREMGTPDILFGAPMDRPSGSRMFTGEVAAEVTQAGYSAAYLSSLDAQERALLLDGLAQEGMLSPEERERKSAALIAASSARSGASTADN